MNAKNSHYERLRVLPEFVCDAIPAPGITMPSSPARGVNEDHRLVDEIVFQAPPEAISPERSAELRRLSTADLLALVQNGKLPLAVEEIKAILHIAIDRLNQQDNLAGAKQLLSTATELVCKVT